MAKRDIDIIRFYMMLTSAVMIFIYVYFKDPFEVNWIFYVILSIMLTFNLILWILEKKEHKK